MIHKLKPVAVAALVLLFSTNDVDPVRANGGPFVVKYPNGDPAAKGVLARLDPSLKPTRITRLRVVEEDLTIAFTQDRWVIPARADENAPQPPLVEVTAAYTIENPTAEDVTIDFGFPILRGIYIPFNRMMLAPDVRVTMTPETPNRNAAQAAIPNASVAKAVATAKPLKHTVISNSAIYGMIRQRAREVIDGAVEADPTLKRLVTAVRKAPDAAGRETARTALADHLSTRMKWTERDAALLVEYASLDFGGKPRLIIPRDRGMLYRTPNMDKKIRELILQNLGPLAAIGEQKTTQFFARLASRFDPKTAAAYEDIFKAWGGDIRERSVDLVSGAVRPREIEIDRKKLSGPIKSASVSDPTIYARVNYFDENAKISESEKASCKTILKNLPVIFTFAPMNLLHYQAKFPARSTQVLTVKYKQYAFKDTRAPRTYQLAYVVHPASMWNDFGPINLKVLAPEDIRLRSSSSCRKTGTEQRDVTVFRNGKNEKSNATYSVYETRLPSKKGELLVAIDAAGWDRFVRLDPTTMARGEQQVQKAPQPR